MGLRFEGSAPRTVTGRPARGLSRVYTRRESHRCGGAWTVAGAGREDETVLRITEQYYPAHPQNLIVIVHPEFLQIPRTLIERSNLCLIVLAIYRSATICMPIFACPSHGCQSKSVPDTELKIQCIDPLIGRRA